jgi:hypothetical protein
MVADDPDCKIDLKAFHCEIQNNHETLRAEQKGYKPLPRVRRVDNSMVQRNYHQIKKDVEDLVSAEMDRMMGDPQLAGQIIKKQKG